MTLDEMGAVMDVLTVAYPNYYRNVSEDDKFNASRLWADMFADDSVDIVLAAVKSFIATDTKGFPPVIGVIKSHVCKLTYGYQKTELEAWEEVRNALRNSNYYAQIEFDKLDPLIQRVVGSPSQLREWAMVESGTPINVVASNFQRSYKAISENQREYRALPGPVAEMVNAIAATKDLSPEPEEPKALPVSIQATVDELKHVVGKPPARDIPTPLSQEDFEKKRAEILAKLQEATA